MRVVCAGLGTGLVVSSGANSHVDLLAASLPTLALSKLVNSLTGGVPAGGSDTSSPNWCATTTGPTGSGSGSSFARLLGGAPLSVVRQYIEHHNCPV
jgi:putative transposase